MRHYPSTNPNQDGIPTRTVDLDTLNVDYNAFHHP
jgi:hypothetical protein